MKTKFSTYDLICSITELQRLIGMRVNQVYDVDHKTYLIRLQNGENKELLLFESGIRIHTTSFEWPKNAAPSGFSMKMRKHIRNKRLEKLNQIGLDRIVDMQFGSGEAAYHVILELYDKGNIILTDHSYLILNVLRPHTEGDSVKFIVKEKYPSNRGKNRSEPPNKDSLTQILQSSKPTETLKKILNPHFVYGPAILEHSLFSVGISPSCKFKDFNLDESITKLIEAINIAEKIIDEAFEKKNNGYIIQKKENKVKENEEILTNQEFHPIIFEQHKNSPYIFFESFDKAVDDFFSNMEGQKIDMKAIQQESAALKKLENVRKDHEKRIMVLEKSQLEDTKKAELIERNQKLVDDAIISIRQAIANQMSWRDINMLVKEATNCGDTVASIIKDLKFDINNISLLLSDPYEEYDENGEALFKPTLIDVDLDLSAFANAEKYYNKKKQAATKQRKTIESQDKAFKSAEKKTKQTLKEVKTSVSISKARKVYWFEKFFWFISSENYLVIGGRDQQQNELIVKKYLKTNDIYVHAGIVGASSVVIKNPTKEPVPPKTLNEAGTMAMCYSTAWEAKVVTSAWWVHANQVSKTAPTGEYLTTGSFMIRGKKNFLPQSYLILGFTFLFKLEDSSVERHLNERKRREIDAESVNSNVENETADVELEINDSDSSENESEDKDKNILPIIDENPEYLYPDTEVVVEHKTDENQCNIQIKLPNTEKKVDNVKENNDKEDEFIVYLGDSKPVIVKPSQNKNSSKSITYHKYVNEKSSINQTEQNQSSKHKRGQKSKLKKIKEKYKDQDEEERQLRMRILQGSPTRKDKKKNDKNKKKTNPVIVKKDEKIKKNPLQVQLLSFEDAKVPTEVNDLANEEDDDGKDDNIEIDVINSLTGQPLPEDELLFTIPVVAPYNSITNYKYKVKLTPGTSKRGKAAKTALNVFLKEKSATQREKDLLKFVKDQDLARNFPGKVKVSAPQLMKHK